MRSCPVPLKECPDQISTVRIRLAELPGILFALSEKGSSPPAWTFFGHRRGSFPRHASIPVPTEFLLPSPRRGRGAGGEGGPFFRVPSRPAVGRLGHEFRGSPSYWSYAPIPIPNVGAGLIGQLFPEVIEFFG